MCAIWQWPFIEMWSFDTVHTDPRKNVDSCWSEYYVDPDSYMGMERQSLNYAFFGLCFSFRSCTQPSTVVGSLLQTGKTTSQRLKLRSSTSKNPKFSASGTKPTEQISPWEKSQSIHHICCTIIVLKQRVGKFTSLGRHELLLLHLKMLLFLWFLIHVLIWGLIQPERLPRWCVCVDSRVRWRQVEWLLTTVHVSCFMKQHFLATFFVESDFLYSFSFPLPSSLLLPDTDMVRAFVFVFQSAFWEKEYAILR